MPKRYPSEAAVSKHVTKIMVAVEKLQTTYEAKMPDHHPLEGFGPFGVTVDVLMLLANADACARQAEVGSTNEGFRAQPAFLLEAAEVLLEAARKIAMAEAVYLQADSD